MPKKVLLCEIVENEFLRELSIKVSLVKKKLYRK